MAEKSGNGRAGLWSGEKGRTEVPVQQVETDSRPKRIPCCIDRGFSL